MGIDFSERRFQVFVSSTFSDLQTERQKVLQAILEMKAFPAGMELFPSANDDQWEFIKREIDSSDYYIVIIAGKYGSIAPDGISYTEKEYDYAIAAGKPVMAFLSKNLDELPGKSLESDPVAKKKLLKFHAKAKRAKLVKFFTNPEELKSAVLMSLLHSFQISPAQGWVRAKNARRIEDLEEIANLQRQVSRLEKELDSLRTLESEGLAQLAQGDDREKWEIRVVGPEDKSQTIQPTLETFEFSTTWNNLFHACFIYGFPRIEVAQIEKGLAFLAKIGLKTQNSGQSFDHISRESIERTCMTNMIGRMRIQLYGLGYIDIEEEEKKQEQTYDQPQYDFLILPPQRLEFWKLTKRGASRFALLAGRKKSAKPEDLLSK